MKISIRDSSEPLSDEVLSDVEKRLGIVLPPEYRAFLSSHNGGIPRPQWFRLRLKPDWIAARRSPGHLRWLGYSYGSEWAREKWKDWGRVSRFFGVTVAEDLDPLRPGLEQAYRQRPTNMPEGLAPIALVESFQLDGMLCVNVTSSGPGRGRILFWPDLMPGSVVTPGPLASSLDALMEILRDLGEAPPEWLALVQDGDLAGFRDWIERNPWGLREKDMWGLTSLDHAVFEGRGEIVAFLLEKRDASPSMVFYDALGDGRFSTARGMLKLGVDAEFIRPALGRKAQEFWTDLEMVVEFLDAGADLEYIDDIASCGNSPLHYAAQSGEADAVRLLLSRGADPYVENEQGECPRDLAVVAGYTQVAEILSEAGATRPEEAEEPKEPEEVELHGVAITRALPGLDADALDALEARLQIRLPGEYRAFLGRFNGGTPRPAVFRLRGEDGDGDESLKCEIARFLSVGGVTKLGEDSDLEATRATLSDWGLPRRMLPIAAVDDEISGGLLCISVRGKDRGRIAYYPQNDSTESTTYPVAKSLSRFFALLSKSKNKSPVWVRAIEDDDLATLQAWFDEGGSIKKRYRGRTPLEIAVENRRTKIVNWLLERGVKAKDAFELAVDAGWAEIMLDLLGREDVRKAVPAGVLGRCVLAPEPWRHPELVGLLVDLGADLNGIGGAGLTPLMIAAQHATPDVVRMLLARGARAGVWSQQGQMALHRAVTSTSRDEMLEKMRILIDAGESLHARAPHSASPDHVLKTTRAMETPIGELLEQGGLQAFSLEKLLGSLARNPDALPTKVPAFLPVNPYLSQFQRTAADLFLELQKDDAALKDLEEYESRRQG